MTLSAHALDLQGHRGARGLAPENTLPAFERALEIGVTTLELDVGLTRDGVVVIAHERTLNPDLTRDAQGKWLEGAPAAIHALTYEELARYDVGRLRPGTAYAKRFPRQRPVDGARIPALADLFELVRRRGDARVRFNIETKLSPLAPDETAAPEAIVAALLAAIGEAGMASRVTIQSFDWRTLAIVQKTAPSIPTVYLTAESASPKTIALDGSPSPWTAGHQASAHGGSLPRTVKAAGGAVWSPYHRDLTPERLREAHALGLKVVVWTVNAEADMRQLAQWGVDGIISDYPDVLATTLRSP
jgi:glycerophosphoryl diester phosphodiesterase